MDEQGAGLAVVAATSTWQLGEIERMKGVHVREEKQGVGPCRLGMSKLCMGMEETSWSTSLGHEVGSF